MLQVTTWQLLVLIVTIVVGIFGLVYGMRRILKNRGALRTYMARRLPPDAKKRLAEELAKEAPIGLDTWKYESFLSQFDIYSDQQMDLFTQMDLQEWLKLQKQIISLSNNIKPKNSNLRKYQIKNVVSNFTQFSDGDDDAILLNMTPEMLSKILSKIREHRSSVAKYDRSAEEHANA